MKTYSIFISSILLVFLISVSFFSFKSYNLESEKRHLKSDLIELSDIKYGMFNVDKWKEKIAFIIGKKIEELKITENNKQETRQKVISFLEKVISDFERNYKSENRKKSWFGISAKNFGADVFSIFDELKNNIPNIADDIINFLEKKENRDQIKSYIISQLNKYADSTFQKMNYSKFNQILKNYGAENEIICEENINKEIDLLNDSLRLINYSHLFVFLSLFVIILRSKNDSKLNIIFYSLIAVHFLVLGVLLPMIDIDARISSLEFKLLGETISFQNQVLYFKSKSILEMSKIMLLQGEVKILLVGLLVLIFSVLFPVFKVFSTISFLFKDKLIKNPFIKFMVFKSGKWSMADVMVVAIFMSYIGFTGIISSQLSQLEKITMRLNILTTNNSELQSGFFFFVGFVLMSISISQIILNEYEK